MTTILTPPPTEAVLAIGDKAVKGELAQLAARPKKQKGIVGYPTGEGYVADVKHDGWRILAYVHADGVNLYSRTGNSYNGKLPKIEAELLANFPAGTWLDGEAVAIKVENGKVINEWKLAQSVLTKLGANAAADRITFMVFDLIAHGGIDARPLAYGKRRDLLERIFDGESFEYLALSPIREATEENVAAIIAAGYEGAVIKRLNAPYGTGKRDGAGWTKVKPSVSIDAVVMGFKPGENGFKGMVGAIIFGQHDENGKLVERGRASGMDMKTRLDMTKHPEKWIGTVVELGLVAPLGGAGNPPQYKRHRLDRTPESVEIHDG